MWASEELNYLNLEVSKIEEGKAGSAALTLHNPSRSSFQTPDIIYYAYMPTLERCMMVVTAFPE
jgi:hypothetical protein